MALWLLGIPPVSASTRRFSLCCRIEVSVTLATWQIVQATIGASRYLKGGLQRPDGPQIAAGGRKAAGQGAKTKDGVVLGGAHRRCVTTTDRAPRRTYWRPEPMRCGLAGRC